MKLDTTPDGILYKKHNWITAPVRHPARGGIKPPHAGQGSSKPSTLTGSGGNAIPQAVQKREASSLRPWHSGQIKLSF